MIKNLDLYWQSNPDWWHYDEELRARINDNAPEEAKKSYEHYREQKRKNQL